MVIAMSSTACFVEFARISAFLVNLPPLVRSVAWRVFCAILFTGASLERW